MILSPILLRNIEAVVCIASLPAIFLLHSPRSRPVKSSVCWRCETPESKKNINRVTDGISHKCQIVCK